MYKVATKCPIDSLSFATLVPPVVFSALIKFRVLDLAFVYTTIALYVTRDNLHTVFIPLILPTVINFEQMAHFA